MITKTCTTCGKELPSLSFYSSKTNSDGLSDECRSCKLKNKTPKHGCNPQLANFHPRELIAELRARGYKGELKYVQTITV